MWDRKGCRAAADACGPMLGLLACSFAGIIYSHITSIPPYALPPPAQQVEAKYPALLFKQQLDAFVQKIFPMLRDNVKKEISPQLAACIHAPRQKGARGARRTTSGAAALAAAAADGQQPGTPGTPGGSRPSTGGEAAGGLSPHWASMLRVFDGLLAVLRENHVPPFLVQNLFEQLVSFVDVQLFNQLVLRRECCSCSNGEYVKAGLSEVEQWLYVAGEEWVSAKERAGQQASPTS